MALFSSPLSAQRLDPEENLQDYKAVCGSALIGLLLGLFSVVAFVHPLLLLAPLAGILVNVYALRQLALASPPQVGWKAALIGLACSLICGISAPLQYGLHRRALRAEAVAIADEFFTALRENHPDAAYRLTQYPTTRAGRANPSRELMMDDNRSDLAHASMRRFTQEPPVSLILKLGKRARVRLYQHEEVWSDVTSEGVRDVYVITAGEGPRASSFFVRLGCTRTPDIGSGEAQWQVTKHEFISMPSEAMLDALGG
ncbi:MAG TPA: hypothetical protein VFI31_27480 [Pirellulales bacterium]|nr:hypothetical protein [Pirellulales bacterium]